tara:strand:- start:2566 stop:4026 length:1461 start_codon:yes stop_codon:yes gene_type:complete
MSKLTFSNTGVTTGQPVLASQVSQSFDAFTGAGDYAITISGSLTTAANSQVSLGGDLVLADNVSAISQSNFTASAGGGGNVILKYNESTKLATSATGVDMSGKINMVSNDITNAGTIVASDITASTSIRNEGNTFLGNANTDKVVVTGSLEIMDPGSGDSVVSMSIDNDEFLINQGADGTMVIGNAQLTIKSQDNTETIAIFNEDADCQLFFNNVRRLRTVSTGVEVTASSANTGIIVTDGTNNSTRSATATKFNFDGNTYVSNESTNGAAKVAFALGGTAAANAKVAVSSSNDLHVYSGSINVGSGQSTFTGSFGISKGNLNANATQNAVGYQSSEFIIPQQAIDATPDIIFRYYPWDSTDKGTYPLPPLDNSNNFVVTMHANLILMERGSTLVNPEAKVGYLEYSSVFGLRGAGYIIEEVTGGGVTIANKTSQVLTSGDGEFFIASGVGDQGYISVRINQSGTPLSAFPQIGGTVRITVAQQIA